MANLINLDLIEQEKLIESGLKSFYEVGKALMEIRDKKLYKEKYSTFEIYCRDRWQMSRPRAYQLIEGSKIKEILSTIVDKIPEGQARELAKVEPEKQAEVYQTVIDKTEGKPTAKAIKKEIELLEDAEIITDDKIKFNPFGQEFRIKCIGVDILISHIQKQSGIHYKEVLIELKKQITKFLNKK